MPLVIDSLGGRHTQTYRPPQSKKFQNQASAGLNLASAPGLKVNVDSFRTFKPTLL